MGILIFYLREWTVAYPNYFTSLYGHHINRGVSLLRLL